MRPSLSVVTLVFLLSSSGAAHAAAEFTLPIEIGPVKGTSGERRSLTFDNAALRQTRSFDVQDGREHIVRGLPLRELVALVRPPRAVDAVIFVYSDGMQIPVQLSDKGAVDAIFIALAHGDVRDRFGTTYPLQDKTALSCPKVVFGRKITTYSIWLYPTQLASIKLVSWSVYEAALAQATRRAPDRSGWPIYLRNCQPCHGIGGQGAARGPDFLSNMDAYRRVPPLAVTDLSEQPSLHEKVKGYTDGSMPVLNHISNAEITTLWRWLHAIHRGATR